MNRLPRGNAKNHPGTQGTVAPTGCHAIGNNLSRINAAGPPLAIFHLKQEARRGVSKCTSSLPQRDDGLPNGRPHWHSSSKSTTERENRLRRSRTPPLTAFVCLFFVKTRTCQRYVASSCDVNFPREHRSPSPRKGCRTTGKHQNPSLAGESSYVGEARRRGRAYATDK